MDLQKIVQASRDSKAKEKPQRSSAPVKQLQLELQPTQQQEVVQPDQPKPVAHLESLAEFIPEESVYGSGWSLAELLDEFADR